MGLSIQPCEIIDFRLTYLFILVPICKVFLERAQYMNNTLTVCLHKRTVQYMYTKLSGFRGFIMEDFDFKMVSITFFLYKDGKSTFLEFNQRHM